MVGLSGLEPPTSRLSGVRSNRLSYRPMRVKQLPVGLFPSSPLSYSSLFLVQSFDVHWKMNSVLHSRRPFFSKSVCSVPRSTSFQASLNALLRKEVIQPHLPIRLPCYDFTPIINPTFDCCPPKVSSQASGVIDSHGVTGGVYKARERIHRGMLIRDY